MLDTIVSEPLLPIEGTKTAVESARLTAVVSVEGKLTCRSRLGTTIEFAVESMTIGPTACPYSVASLDECIDSSLKSIMPVAVEKNLYVVENDRFAFVLARVTFWKSVW